MGAHESTKTHIISRKPPKHTKIHRKHMGVHESTVQEAAHRPAAPSPAPAPAPTCLVRRLEMQSTATTVPRSKRTYLPTYLPTTSRRLASLFLTSHREFLTSHTARCCPVGQHQRKCDGQHRQGRGPWVGRRREVGGWSVVGRRPTVKTITWAPAPRALAMRRALVVNRVPRWSSPCRVAPGGRVPDFVYPYPDFACLPLSAGLGGP